MPEWGTLGDYLDRFDEEWVNCLGYELAAPAGASRRCDLDRPILDQRGHWFFNDGYNKAALATDAADVEAGLPRPRGPARSTSTPTCG